MPSDTEPAERGPGKGRTLRRLLAVGAVVAGIGLGAVVGTPAASLAQSEETTTTTEADQSTDTTVVDETTDSQSTERPDHTQRGPGNCEDDTGSDTAADA